MPGDYSKAGFILLVTALPVCGKRCATMNNLTEFR